MADAAILRGTRSESSRDREVPKMAALRELLAQIRRRWIEEGRGLTERVFAIEDCRVALETGCRKAGVDIPTISRWLGHRLWPGKSWPRFSLEISNVMEPGERRSLSEHQCRQSGVAQRRGSMVVQSHLWFFASQHLAHTRPTEAKFQYILIHVNGRPGKYSGRHFLKAGARPRLQFSSFGYYYSTMGFAPSVLWWSDPHLGYRGRLEVEGP